MVNIKRDLDEICYLNKEINYRLAMSGGSQKEFDDIFKKYKLPINWTIYLTIFLILYYIFKNNISSYLHHELKNIKNKDTAVKMQGGSLLQMAISNSASDSFDLKKTDDFNKIFGKAGYDDSDDFIDWEKEINFESFDKFMETATPALVKISTVTENQLEEGLNVKIVVPFVGEQKLKYIMVGLYIVIIFACILIMLVVGNLMGTGGIIVPCFGCGKSSKVFKCSSGTGYGTSSCESHKKRLGVWNKFIGSLGSIGSATDDLTSFIGKAISFIVDGVVWLFKAILALFLLPGKLLDALARGIPYMSVSSDFEINLGDTLLGCGNDVSEDECLYEFKDGVNTYNLRKHGRGAFLKEVFDILKDFLWTIPFPDLDWDLSFGGGSNSDNKPKKVPLANKQLQAQDAKNLEAANINTKDESLKTNPNPDSITKPQVKVEDMKSTANPDGTVGVVKPPEEVEIINKSNTTKKFEAFKKHIDSLKYPKVRKIFDPSNDGLISDEEYFKRYEQTGKYYNYITNDLATDPTNQLSKNLKTRITKYASKLIKQKSPSQRLKINPGDIAVETDNEYAIIQKLSNDMYLHSLNKDRGLSDEEKRIQSNKEKSKKAVTDSEESEDPSSKFDNTSSTNLDESENESAFREFEEKQAAEEAEKLERENRRQKEQQELEKAKNAQTQKQSQITRLLNELQKVKALLGPKNNGKSNKKAEGMDLLIFKYQYKEKDLANGIKRSNSYYNKKYRKKLKELRAQRFIIQGKITKIKNQQQSAKDANASHFLYINLIRLLIAIRFNPLGLIAKFVNAVIYVVNNALKYIIVIPLKFLVNATISMISFLIESLVNVLEMVVKEVLKPLKGTIKKIKTIPITSYKMFNWIIGVGPLKFIFYSIYYVVSGVVGDFLPHLATVIVTIIIIIILCVCPMIGFYSAFGSAMSTIIGFLISILKLFIYTIVNIFGEDVALQLMDKLTDIYNYDYNYLYNYLNNYIKEWITRVFPLISILLGWRAS